MIRYVVSRLVVSVAMVLLATLVIFLIANTVPGDPVLTALGDMAASDPAQVAEFRARWGLDLPLWHQYWLFLERLAHGDLGVSISSRRPVLQDIIDYAPATLELATVAFILSLLVGLPLGVLAAVRRDTVIDHVARAVSLVGVSAPTFWLAFIALAVFYGWLNWAPGPGRLDAVSFPPDRITGLLLIDTALQGDWETFRDAAAHLVLPSIVLAAATLGLITRTTRAAMLEALSQDYVRVAKAKGLRGRLIVLRHALPNAMLPVVTLGGLAYANLLAGAVMTETVFSWPGLGRYTFRSAVTLDFPAIMGITLIVAVVYLIINLLIDVSYAILDPRVLRRCRRLLRDEGKALDAMHDVFVELLKRETRLDDSAPAALLMRVATNVCLNRLRTEHRQSWMWIPGEFRERGRGTERERVDDAHHEPWPGKEPGPGAGTEKPITAKANNRPCRGADRRPRPKVPPKGSDEFRPPEVLTAARPWRRLTETSRKPVCNQGVHVNDADSAPKRGRAQTGLRGGTAGEPVKGPPTISDVAELAANKVDMVKIWVDDHLGRERKIPFDLSKGIIESAHANHLRVAAHIFYLDDAKALVEFQRGDAVPTDEPQMH